jgi:hypothetical protein
MCVEWKNKCNCVPFKKVKSVIMVSYEISNFIDRLNVDIENKEVRRRFHENYEWLESYWKRKFGGNNGNQLFCNNHGEFYWQIDDIKNTAKQLTAIRPVGSSNNNFQPTVSTYRATYFLKYNSDLYLEGENEEIQDETAHANNWNSTSFHALFAIMKQIRDNLFHGRKIDLDEVQYQRNKELVEIGADLTDLLLLNLNEAEANI